MHIKENNPDLWAYALESDTLIKSLPNYANASYEKRFADVLALVELKHGAIKLPNTETPAGGKTVTPKALDNAVPNSLSDITGTARATETPTLYNANPGQIREMFKGKGSDEIMAAIRNL